MCSFKEVTLLLSVFCTLYTGISSLDNRLKNFCYFTNWSHQRQNSNARFEISDINVTLCTHLIYAFANIDVTNLRLTPSSADDENGPLVDKKGKYFDFNNLKKEHPKLETLLSVGGAKAGTSAFGEIVKSESTMKLFSTNVAVYLRDRDFDGIDIDWEWPGVIYKDKFSQLLKVMWAEFVREAAQTMKPRLLISIAVGVGANTITESYNIKNISQHVDYIQVMAYDFHGPWSQVTSFSAPLFSRASSPMFNQELSQAWAIDRWISGGASRDKLIMGLTGVATTFILVDTDETDVGSPVSAPGSTGPYIGELGRVSYYRACEMIKTGAVQSWDDEQKMGYAVLGNQWLGYGNQKSMEEKVKFAYNRNIAGIMFWSLDLDDFKGTFCNVGKYPLLTAIHNSIRDMAPKEPNGVTTTTSTTSKDMTNNKDNTEPTDVTTTTSKDITNNTIRISITNSLLFILILCSYTV